jgi:hypothetical protein
VCTFDGNFVVSRGSEASLTIEGTGTGSNSSAASVLDGGNPRTNNANTFSGGIRPGTSPAPFPITLNNVTVTGIGIGIFSGGFVVGGTMPAPNPPISGNDITVVGIDGGIFNNGTMTIVNSTISGNNVTGITNSGIGGGITNYGTITITNSTINGNTAGSGGGIFNNGTMTIVNSTISGNNSPNGAGIYNSRGTMTVINSTISGNQNGSGIDNPAGTVTVAGSIVADQTSGGNCIGTITDAGYNLSNGGSCGFGTQTNTSASYVTNLNLGTLASNGGATETVAIPGSSSAAAFITSPATVTLGSSTVDLCTDTSYTTASGYVANLSVDQRGVSRPTFGCSAGAYQWVTK